jgi:hypothetical protein
MKLLEIQDIDPFKKDIPLYYRRDYSARGSFKKSDGLNVLVDFHFSVEALPTGDKEIRINLQQNIDYPLIPVIRALKEEIQNLYSRGDLRL